MLRNSHFTHSLSSLPTIQSHGFHLQLQPILYLSLCTNNNNNQILDFFDSLLNRCSKSHQHKQIHAQIFVTNSHRSAFLASRLVSAYSRSGLIGDAQRVFEQFTAEFSSNMLLWNSIVRANVSHMFYGEALEMFDEMLRRRVWPDGFTFPLVVRACSFIEGVSLGLRVHALVLQMGFWNHIHVVNELLGMYAKLGLMVYAKRVFDGMRNGRSHVTWNTMVSGYAFNRDCDGAIRMFERMRLEGFEPNSVTWTSLLSSHARCERHEKCFELFDSMRSVGVSLTAELLAVVLSVCADLASMDKGKMVHGCVVKGGFGDYLFVKNALICMYGKCRDVETARRLFSEMGTKNLVSWNVLISCYADYGLCDEAFEAFSQLEKVSMRPNIVTWSAIIGCFASEGRGEESLELFRRMQLAKVTTNSVNICSVLSVCADLAALNLGREIHGHVVRALMDDNILVGNALINMYTKCGNFKQGHVIFENLNDKDLISWNTMITAYGMHGLGESALRMFHRMIEAGFNPDNVTFVAILSACSHSGLVSEGRSVFNQMSKVYGIEPQMEHYACMVDLLGRSGLLQEASSVVDNMPIEPNACVWSALLNSCRTYKDTHVAEETASRIFNTISGKSGSYMLVSNIYAWSGRWDEAARVRILANANGLKKTPGLSWVEVKKKVYTFSSGNAAQVGLEPVYQVLGELALQMESQGCVIKRAVSDGGEMEMMIETQQ